MKTSVYFDPFKRELLMETNVEIIKLHTVSKIHKFSTPSEIVTQQRYDEHRLLSALVRFKDGTITDNIFIHKGDITQ